MGLTLMRSENLIKSVVLATVVLLGIITTPVHSSVVRMEYIRIYNLRPIRQFRGQNFVSAIIKFGLVNGQMISNRSVLHTLSSVMGGYMAVGDIWQFGEGLCVELP